MALVHKLFDTPLYMYMNPEANVKNIYFVPWFIRPSFFYFLFYRFFSQQVSVGGRNKNKIHSDHFPIELKSKETHCVSVDFNSTGKWSE